MKGQICSLYICAVFSLSAHAEIVSSKCVAVVPGGARIPFKIVNGDPADKQYRTSEKLEIGAMTLRFMEGHGQSRLEAYKNGKLVAATFSSRSIELNLAVSPLEVGCYGLNGQTE